MACMTAYFKREWKLGASVGARLVMESFGGAQSLKNWECAPPPPPHLLQKNKTIKKLNARPRFESGL